MGETAENVAEQCGITREEQDAFALESQRRAGDAIDARRLRRGDRAGRGSAQEGRPASSSAPTSIRAPDTTLEKLAALEAGVPEGRHA